MKELGELVQISEGQNYQGFHHHSLTSTFTDERMTGPGRVSICNKHSEAGVDNRKLPTSIILITGGGPKTYTNANAYNFPLCFYFVRYPVILFLSCEHLGPIFQNMSAILHRNSF